MGRVEIHGGLLRGDIRISGGALWSKCSGKWPADLTMLESKLCGCNALDTLLRKHIMMAAQLHTSRL